MVCPEATSTAAHGGSNVVYEIGIGEETIVYVLKQHLISMQGA